MTLSKLLVSLDQHGVNLILTDTGRLKPTADRPPPAEVIEAIKAHRAVLVRHLERGQTPDGRIDMQRLAQQQGVCLTCARWQTDEFGDGLCPLGRRAHGWYDGNPTLAVITTAAHRCAAHGGAGWQAK